MSDTTKPTKYKTKRWYRVHAYTVSGSFGHRLVTKYTATVYTTSKRAAYTEGMAAIQAKLDISKTAQWERTVEL